MNSEDCNSYSNYNTNISTFTQFFEAVNFIHCGSNLISVHPQKYRNMSGGIPPLFHKLGFTFWLLCLMCEVNGKHHKSQCRSGNLTKRKIQCFFRKSNYDFSVNWPVTWPVFVLRHSGFREFNYHFSKIINDSKIHEDTSALFPKILKSKLHNKCPCPPGKEEFLKPNVILFFQLKYK